MTSNCKTDGVTGYLLSARVLNISWHHNQVTFLAPQKSFKLARNVSILYLKGFVLVLVELKDPKAKSGFLKAKTF